MIFIELNYFVRNEPTGGLLMLRIPDIDAIETWQESRKGIRIGYNCLRNIGGLFRVSNTFLDSVWSWITYSLSTTLNKFSFK